jgi:hypothetical protein
MFYLGLFFLPVLCLNMWVDAGNSNFTFLHGSHIADFLSTQLNVRMRADTTTFELGQLLCSAGVCVCVCVCVCVFFVCLTLKKMLLFVAGDFILYNCTITSDVRLAAYCHFVAA